MPPYATLLRERSGRIYSLNSPRLEQGSILAKELLTDNLGLDQFVILVASI